MGHYSDNYQAMSEQKHKLRDEHFQILLEKARSLRLNLTVDIPERFSGYLDDLENFLKVALHK